jgi:hemolysin D
MTETNGMPPTTTAKLPAPEQEAPKLRDEEFEQPVVLQQSLLWSRGIIWGIIGVTAAVLLWSWIARIEEAVPATGELQAQGSTQEVKAPLNGVVKQVFVEDGKRVKKGQILLTLDPQVSTAQLTSLQKNRAELLQENAYYRSILQNQGAAGTSGTVKVDPNLASLASNRAALLEENKLYRAELTGEGQLSLAQQERLRSNQSELASRRAAAELEVFQLREQLAQAKSELASARDVLAINQGILKDIEPAVKAGALAKVQYLNQVQEVRTKQAEVDRLVKEQQRLSFAIAQAQKQSANTVDTTRKEVLTQIAENEKRIAEIDSQFSKTIVDNQRNISEIDSQLSEAKATLGYQEVRSPLDGVVFDLKANTPGYVSNINSNEPLLKIVPTRNLVAKVYIQNKDIGFVDEGMPVDVRVDTFPYSEFGDVKGKLSWIGGDALPPTQERQFYSFPARVTLDQQSMQVRGKSIPLQSGMAVSVNVKVRDRSILSIFTDLFVRQVEPLKNVR